MSKKQVLIDYDLYQEELKAQFDKGCIKALDGFRVELWEVYRDKEVVCDPHQAAFRLKELFGNRTDLLKDVARLMGKFFQGAGSALIGGALSGISNLFGAHSQNQSVDKQLAAAREEAEKTRKWQTSEREAQNDWNLAISLL